MSNSKWDHLGPSRKQGWEFKGLSERGNARFAYSVYEKGPDGRFAEIPGAGAHIVRPCTYEFSIAALLDIKRERSFATAVCERLVDEGLAAFENQGNVLELRRA